MDLKMHRREDETLEGNYATDFGKARQTFHVPFESLVSKEHSAEVMLALHQTSSAVLATPTLFFLCAENYLVFGERSKVGRSEKAGFHSLGQNLPSFVHEGT